MRSLLPLPITFILYSLKSISCTFIPTNSDKRSPQLRNRVIIAKSRSLFSSFSSFSVTVSNFLLSSNDKYLGKRLSNLGVSKFCAGLFSIKLAFCDR